MGIIVCEAAAGNKILYVNDAWCSITGYTREDAVGKMRVSFLQGDGSDRDTVQSLRRAVADRKHISTELLNYRKDGTPFWNRMTIDPSGEQFVGTVSNVTEVRRLRDHDALLRTIDCSTDLVVQIENCAGVSTRTYSSVSHKVVLGHDPMSCNGDVSTLTHLYHPDFLEKELPLLIDAFENTEIQDGYGLPIQLRHANGHFVWFEWRIVTDPLYKNQALLIFRDITAMKEAYFEKERIAADLSRLIETANAPIFSVDTSYNIVDWNAKVSTMTGYTKEEVLGTDIVRYVAPEFQESFRDVLKGALNNVEGSSYEVALVSKVGDVVHVLFTPTTRCGIGDKIVGVVGIGQDVTEDHRKAVRFETVLEHGNDGMMIVKLSGNGLPCIVHGSSSLSRLLGVDIDLGDVTFFPRILSPETAATLHAGIRSLQTVGKFERRIEHRGRFLRVCGHAVGMGEIFATFSDITGIELKYSHALDTITDVVIHAIADSWEGEWHVQSASRSFGTLFGREVGCTLSELAGGEELSSAVAESRGSTSRVTVRVGERTVQVQMVDLSEMEGTPSLLLVCHDLTDFKVIPLHNTKQKPDNTRPTKAPHKTT